MFDMIVLKGQFKGLGMVGFSDVLSQDDSDAIYAYILQRAYEDQQLSQTESGWSTSLKLWVYEKLASLLGGFILD